MFLLRRNDIDDRTDVVYVDGAFVTSVTIFLIFCAIATPAVVLSGMVMWLSKHMIVYYAAYIISVVLIIFIQSRHTHKYYMICYYLSTIIVLFIPFAGALVYIFPIYLVGGNVSAGLSVIFSVLLLYGGAFLTFAVNKMLKSGISCVVVALVYFFLGALMLYGFLNIDSKALSGVEWSAIYAMW